MEIEEDKACALSHKLIDRTISAYTHCEIVQHSNLVTGTFESFFSSVLSSLYDPEIFKI